MIPLLLVMAVVALSCGAGAAPQPTAAAAAPATQPAPTEVPTDTPTPQRSGTLRVATEPLVQTDPAFISNDPEVLVANHVYDYLVDIDADNEIVPRLAREWEQSEDGRTWVFRLAQEVTWHDGSPFSAEDVVWTYDRLRDPELGSPTADLYKNIQSIQASGDLEVTFSLEKPNPFFLFDLSDNHALVLKSGTEDAASTFNGSGPFRVVEYSPEDRIVMEANQDYWVEGQPKLASLEVLFFNDFAAMADALRGGQVDLVLNVSTPLYQGLQQEPGVQALSVATNSFPVVRLRADEPPGDDPRVMQAMRHAMDRQAIFELVQQGHGAIGRDTPIGPLYESYYTEAIPLPERDVDRARELLAQAGHPDGLELTLRVPDGQNFPDLAVVLKDQLAEAGIRIEPVIEPTSVYYGQDQWLEATFGITGWGSRPYPQFYLDVSLRCGAKWNESHFCDSEFDELVELAGTTLDEEERVAAYLEIQRILIERGPIMVPYFFPQQGAASRRVQGLEFKAFPGRSDFRTVTLGP